MGNLSRMGFNKVTNLSTIDQRGEFPLISCCNASGIVGVFKLQDRLRRLAVTKTHSACATSVDMNSETARLASCAEDGSINIADLNTLADISHCNTSDMIIPKFKKDEASLNDIHFIGSDTLAIAGSMRGAFVRVCDMRSYPQSGFTVLKASSNFSTDASVKLTTHSSRPYVLASGDIEGRITIWDRRTNAAITVIKQHTHSITALRFHPVYPNVLFSSGNDGLVKFYDISAPNEESGMTGIVHESFGKMPCISLDLGVDEVAGPLLMVAGQDEVINVRALYW